MKHQRLSCIAVRKLFRRPILVGAVLAVFVFLLTVVFRVNKAASIVIPPEVEKKTVELQKNHVDDEHFFRESCLKCHQLPDPVKSIPVKSACQRNLSRDDLVRIGNYMDNVKAGKRLYESNCGRCRSLIDPKSHTFDFWSKNYCTSDSCMVKRRLTDDEEQQVLLYLSSHSRKETKHEQEDGGNDSVGGGICH